MTFANPAALLLLALAVPVVLTHILRPRRMPVTVSSTMLWRRLERPVAAATPWQRLHWSMLLVAQLLAVAGLALAVAKPQRVEASPLAEHTVFIIDASGSMAATDGTPDRLGDAVERAAELRDELPAGGLASIIVAGDTPRVVLTASPDAAAFGRALRTIDQSFGHPDFADSFALAESLDTGQTPIGFVFVTDGGVDPAEARLLPAGTRIERVGEDATNRAITRLTIDERSTGLHARVTVRNAGGPAATQTVRIDVDGVTVDASEVSLGRGETADVEFDLPAGDLVEAFLEGGDLLGTDDHAVAVARQAENVRVLLAGDGLFWGELLAAIPGVRVETTPDSVAADGYDLAIYSGVAVPAEPGAPFVAVAPPGGLVAGADDTTARGVVVSGEVELPAVTLVRTDDALLNGIDLSDVAISTAQRVESDDAETLVAGEAAPLVLRGQFGGHRFVYFTFDLRDSNLGVQVAFPLLAERLVGQLSGTETAGVALTVGDRLPIPDARADPYTVTGPDSRPFTVESGDPVPVVRRPGFFRIAGDDRPEVVVAVNVPASESVLASGDVEAPAPTAGDAAMPHRRATSLLPWVLWPLLAIVAVEVLLAWRRVGVGRKQWRVAVALRAVVTALLIAALVDPHVRRTAESVATVFVVDASASVGAAGVDAAERFVDAALDARPGSSLAGVVLFGADARVDHVMGEAESFGGSPAVVDRSATDIEGGLRLGAALLPDDARRRIVLLSDGRPTSGDVSEQLAELEERGIAVDVATLDSMPGADVAVAGIDLPDLARPDEVVPVVVHVEASAPASASVVLRRDGTEIDRVDVELVAGDNAIRFEDVPGADAGAVMRYEATVVASPDTVAENDTGFGAVAVEGPARVLVIEGSGGAATTLVAALEAAGVGTDVVGVRNVPDVRELISFAGIVMVDVDARDLSGEDVEDLTTAVRDMGRGLVTIGGTRSYGVGGYLESPLNDLLPVDSEVVDPLRRRTVAEVLSIDTSESMGACHCGNGQVGAPGNIDEGGVNKTDISRAAAERTIQALSENDQVGVLAWNSSAEWVIPLQALPAQDVVERGLRSLQPLGNTDLRDSLTDAAEALIASDAELKHIILFSDGFTAPDAIQDTAEQAAQLYADHGITVSVLATGEGAAPLLEDIAEAGRGRFYAGTDLQDVPQIMAEEAVIASRNFITEGEFLPEVTSDDELVAGLTESPPLLGYVATTAKGQAEVLLRIGPDRDPLLATWQAGLGRVTSWTSDAAAWTQHWATWDGYVDFLGSLVKDTLPAGDDAGAVQAQVRQGQLHVSVEAGDAFPDGATATARIAGPDGQAVEIELERTDEGRFEGSTEAPRSGTYAVSASVTGGDGEAVLTSSTLTSNSYPAEYIPGTADRELMARLASLTGGRAEITPEQSWDRDGLRAGHRLVALLPWLLLAAALIFPVAVVLSRLSVRGATVAGARRGVANVAGRVRGAIPRVGGRDPEVGAVQRPSRPADPVSAPVDAERPATAPAASASSLDSLLASKRQRRTPGDEASDG